MKKSIGAKELIFPTPVLIIGTYGEGEKPNAMNVAWGGICSSTPPCIAISIRKQRCTYENIMRTMAFTVNIPGKEWVKEADFCGLVSGKTVDKFKAAGLTAVKGNKVEAPCIKEFPLSLECKVIHRLEIGQHVQFIGEILDVQVEESCLDEQGLPMLEQIKPLAYDHAAQLYHEVGSVAGKAFSAGKTLGE